MIKQVINEAADRLLSLPFFTDNDIAIITENMKDFESRIAELEGRLKLSVVLLAPHAKVKKKDVPGPYFDSIAIVARVHENVSLNKRVSGNEVKALDIAEEVMAALHGFRPDGVSEAIHATEAGITIAAVPLKNVVGYDCNLQTSGGLQNDIPKVATPVIEHADAGGGLTQSGFQVTCATPGAVVVYSIVKKIPGAKNAYPSPRNANADTPTAFFATGPVQGPSEEEYSIWARAWLPGYTASDIAKATLEFLF